MRLTVLPFVCTLLVASLMPVTSVAQVYSWRDASGKIHYGDRPPPTAAQGDARKLPPPPPVNAEAERKAFLEKQKAEQENRKKSAEASAEQEEARAGEAARKENCERSRRNLAGIESGEIRFALGPGGERKALEGPVREAELARARQQVADWCAPPAR